MKIFLCTYPIYQKANQVEEVQQIERSLNDSLLSLQQQEDIDKLKFLPTLIGF